MMQHNLHMNVDNPPLPPPRMDQPIYPAPQYPPGVPMNQRMPGEMNTALDHRLPYGYVSSESVVAPESRLSLREDPNYAYNDHGVITHRLSDGRRGSRGNEFPLKLPLGSTRIDENSCQDSYSQVPHNVPLNNVDERTNFTARRPPDLTIVNNTMAGPSPGLQKNSNIRANMNPMMGVPRGPSSRRASEPPHLIGVDAYHMRNRSNDELNPHMQANEIDHEGEYKEDWSRRRDLEERETARSISRSRLRRDSFGEVVSRRSPSQDSLGISRGGRSSPLLDRPQLDDPSRDRYTPAHDTWSVTGPSSRASPTHDSPEHQVSFFCSS